MIQQDISVYIHWPFCLSKCPYCDFYSVPCQNLDEDAFINSYIKEIESYADLLKNREIKSIYFGGGTPSLMKDKSVSRLLEHINNISSILPDTEITFEANPTSCEKEKFSALQKGGINRLSLGVQSFSDQNLSFLGRQHSSQEAQAALQHAAEIFPRFSFDLIYGLPNQKNEDWQNEMEKALSFHPQHLSLYQLTIEDQTIFSKKVGQGAFAPINDEQEETFFDQTRAFMASHGLDRYEVSNFACCGQESRHNLRYWNYHDYLGFGPSAHGRYRMSGQRFATQNYRSFSLWQKKVEQTGRGHENVENLSVSQAMTEALLMGLRTENGILLSRWQSLFDQDIFSFISSQKAQKLENSGLLHRDQEKIALSCEGLKKLNAVLSFLI